MTISCLGQQDETVGLGGWKDATKMSDDYSLATGDTDGLYRRAQARCEHNTYLTFHHPSLYQSKQPSPPPTPISTQTVLKPSIAWFFMNITCPVFLGSRPSPSPNTHHPYGAKNHFFFMSVTCPSFLFLHPSPLFITTPSFLPPSTTPIQSSP